MRHILLTFSIFALPFAANAASLNVLPEDPIQGDPIMITVVPGPASSTASAPKLKVKSISFDGKPLGLVSYKNIPTAFYGFDINKKPGVSKISARLSDGSIIQKQILIGERKKAEVAFTIPAKLGGNTATSETKLATTLHDENASLLGLRTGVKAFWTERFDFPVADPIVTDPYGYIRQTGATSITHKGTDFRAPEGTPVMAANRGVVRLVQETRNYGKTIVVDHGLGIMTFYMHLSKISVTEGELVKKGQIIALSGQTGYAEHPHLHLTVRIDRVSVDPMVFYSFFR
ncbi:M23 family metallopeptidase [Candidatus Parcubacteria bacterium]|nr:M23 family metallopeptidase [Candidatus Parcubacteria bacterium]